MAVLALAVLFATLPIATAPASAAPCDCPSMHAMHMPDTPSRMMPLKEHRTPCKQPCVCGMSCEAAANTPQIFTTVQNLTAQRVTFGGIFYKRGISIQPAIPPPIASI